MQLDVCRFVIAAATIAISAGSAVSSTVAFRFAASGPSGHAAEASFTFNDAASTVTVELRNTIGSFHKSLDARALTGVFWDLSGAGVFGHSSVAVETGAKVGSGSDTPAQLWGFRGNVGGSAGRFGLGVSGLNEVFAPRHILAPGGTATKIGQLSNAPTGLEGGLLSTTGNAYGGQVKTPMWRDFMRFTFNVDPALFDAGIDSLDVGNVRFQFGSSLNEPAIWDYEGVRFEMVPLPSAAALGAVGLAAVAGPRRRRGDRSL